MRQSKMVGARIPGEWAEQIEAIALDEGVSTADVCRRAFAKLLGKRSPNAGTLEQRIRRLEKQFAAIAAQLIHE